MPKIESRYFCLVTYIQKDELIQLIQNHESSIRSYAFCVHDKDEGEQIHTHIVLRTFRTWSPMQLCKWFKKNKDDQNTFCEIMHDRNKACDYLTHINEPDKHHYDESEIYDCGLDDIRDCPETVDNSMEVIESMLSEVSTRTLVARYGREFVYRYSAFVDVCKAITHEECLRNKFSERFGD